MAVFCSILQATDAPPYNFLVCFVRENSIYTGSVDMGIVLFPYIPGKCDANPYGVDGSWDITIEHLLISAAEKRFVKFFLFFLFCDNTIM